MNFSAILQQAWRFTWRHKSWWWLGLLASLAQAAGIFWLPRWLPVVDVTSEESLLALLESISRAGERWLQPGRLMAGVAAVLGVTALCWLLNLVAEGGMIAAVAGAANGKPLSLRQAAAAGRRQLKRFVLVDTWLYLPALGLTLLILMTLLLLFAGFSWSLSPNSDPGALAAVLLTALVCLTGLALLLLPILLLTGVARQLTFRAVVRQDVAARVGIQVVGRECRQNPGQTLLMIVLLLALRALLSGAIRVSTLPFWLFSLLLRLPQTGSPGSYSALHILADLLRLGLTAVIAVFISAAWTLAYHALSSLSDNGSEMPDSPIQVAI